MKYYSTRNINTRCSLAEAALMGLAPDGGLFMPERIPAVCMQEVERLAGISYEAMASYLARLFFEDDLPGDVIDGIVSRAYGFPCPLERVDEGLYTLELYHGPTFAFKDFGARFMGGMLGYLCPAGETLTVLTATSGDTGSAVAAGFHNVPGIKVVVLYPDGKVSPLQESQMTTLGGNIYPVRVRGNFDDCQAMVKNVFNDGGFREACNVTSANSINILRWIPQSFYYFYGWAQYRLATGRECPDIVVPSGNYGNLTAGMLACKMGLPVRRFIAGSNANDVIPEFLQTGVYRPRPSIRTVANAMDVGAPSNYERMMDLCGADFEALSKVLEGSSWDDSQIEEAISRIYASSGRISDPHSAVGWLAARKGGAEGFYLSTAHSAKFSEVIRHAIGRSPLMPRTLEDIASLPKKYVMMDNDAEKLKEYIKSL